MKLLLLWLLPLLSCFPAAGPPAVRVTFSPLTKAGYLAALKSAVFTKPDLTFPLKKRQGRITTPTSKGPKVFQDKGIGTDDADQAEYIYRGYLPQFGYHVVEAMLWERTQLLLSDKQGREVELYDSPVYSPDMKRFVVASPGIEDAVYPNKIRLFQFEKGRWREVWKLEPSVEPATWEPSLIYWVSNSTLLLQKKMWTGKNPGSTFTYAKLAIQ